MDFIPLMLNSSSLTWSICTLAAMAAIILHLVAIKCQKLHMEDSPITNLTLVSLNLKIDMGARLLLHLTQTSEVEKFWHPSLAESFIQSIIPLKGVKLTSELFTIILCSPDLVCS